MKFFHGTEKDISGNDPTYNLMNKYKLNTEEPPVIKGPPRMSSLGHIGSNFELWDNLYLKHDQFISS